MLRSTLPARDVGGGQRGGPGDACALSILMNRLPTSQVIISKGPHGDLESPDVTCHGEASTSTHTLLLVLCAHSCPGHTGLLSMTAQEQAFVAETQIW